MPMYEYRCRECGAKYEELVSSSQTTDSEVQCPECGKYQSEKLMSAFASSGVTSGGYSSSGSSCGSGGFT